MKKILLVSNYVFHYRQKVYNYFAEKFDEKGYKFHVLAPDKILLKKSRMNVRKNMTKKLAYR